MERQPPPHPVPINIRQKPGQAQEMPPTEVTPQQPPVVLAADSDNGDHLATSCWQPPQPQEHEL